MERGDSPRASIAELADLICPSSCQHKVIALLRAYFDDTGTHRDSRVVGVAGMIGAVSDWVSLEKSWFQVLARYRVRDFHAADCDSASPELAHLSNLERDALVRELAHAIVQQDFLPLSAAVWTDAWRSSVIERPSSAEFLERYRKPFFLCFEHCVQMASVWSRKLEDASPMAIVFNEQGADVPMAAEIFDAYRASKLWGSQLASLTFAPHKGNASLQAVDLIAYEAYQAWTDLLHDQLRLERPALKILSQKEEFLYFTAYDELALTNSVKEFLKNERLWAERSS